MNNMKQKHLSNLKREIMDSIGEIDVVTLATDFRVQNVIQDIHNDLIEIPITRTNFTGEKR
jgi:hypothetical protein